MSPAASPRHCRMLCASNCAYAIDKYGVYSPPVPYHGAVDWLEDPIPIDGGELNTDACLVGVNNDDGIIVAFRGTLPYDSSPASIVDWLTGILDCEPKEVDNVPGKVHRGYWKDLNGIWNDTIAKVQDLQTTYPGKKLFLTGHSKGGTLANLFAARDHFLNGGQLKPKEVFTYAAPHAGDSEFVQRFPLSIPVTRYENRLDFIPYLPPGQELVETRLLFALLSLIIPTLKDNVLEWDYASLGELKYIKKNHSIIGDRPFLTRFRTWSFIRALLRGKEGIEQIGRAHNNVCGYGYMTAVCPTDVCEE